MTIPQYRATRATTERWDLAEGPEWNAARETVTWVDIEHGMLYESPLAGSTLPDVTMVHQSTGSLGFARAGRGGGWILGEQRQLSRLDPDGARVPGPELFTDPRRRINDGAVDPAGAVLAGTLSRDAGRPVETLTRVDSDGHPETLKTDLTLSNGIGFTRDGRTVFLADTLTRTVFSADYDPRSAPRWRTGFVLEEYPDGLCVDTDGMLWVALWGASEVRRYTPDGTVLARVHVSATQVSAVAFVGPDLGTLVITTAAMDVRDSEPDAGALFVADVDATGVPAFLATACWGASDD